MYITPITIWVLCGMHLLNDVKNNIDCRQDEQIDIVVEFIECGCKSLVSKSSILY